MPGVWPLCWSQGKQNTSHLKKLGNGHQVKRPVNIVLPVRWGKKSWQLKSYQNEITQNENKGSNTHSLTVHYVPWKTRPSYLYLCLRAWRSGHMILRRCSCSSDERRPSLEREKNKKSQYIKSLIYWPSLNYKIWGKQEIESKSGEAIKRQILSQKWKGKKKRFQWDYSGTCLLKHLCINYDLRDNLIRRILFLVPTVFSKCRFHDATPTSVTFKEGAHQFMGPFF